jgi:signal transduction histidine kinase/CheY-like chemotaxis protein
MKIKARLNLNTAISLGAVILIVLSLAWSYHKDELANRDMDFADEIRNVAFERIVLRDDYLLHYEDRAKFQWKAKSDELRRLLDVADQRFTGSNDRNLLQEARKNLDAGTASFSAFMGQRKLGEADRTRRANLSESESMLVSQSFLKSYSLMYSIGKLHVSVEQNAIRVRERSISIVVFFMVAGIVVIGLNSMFLNRQLPRRISSLNEGLEILGNGNLGYRIDTQGDDELSAIAIGANEMAGKLMVSHTSVGNLQKEVAERKKAEDTARRETSMRNVLLDNLPCIALIIKKRTHEIVECNAIAKGYGAVIGKACHDAIAVPGIPCPFCLAPESWNTGKSTQIEVEYMGKFWHGIWVPLSDDLYVHYIFEITDRKRGEQEKEKLQGQLQQAMKMEAVGQLAGGVAHDFNNLLTVINGYSELLLQKIGKESPMHGEVEEIRRAGERAASLTRQLLAFSRKQIIEPKVVRMDLLVAEMQKMLARLIGENIDLQTTTGKSPGSVKVDTGQFQQILMNLAVNARDAMPEGGKIVIGTANVDLDERYCATHPYVTPGRYVMLSVSDTGKGMSEEVKAHIFEPFFTTKERGSGTGLGLAMAYGAVRQVGGSIEVVSEVGIGTTFRIYLPRVEEKAVEPSKDELPQDLPAGTETVLVVEDEAIVRDLCVRILERLGYKVLQARNGPEAIVAAEQYVDRIDLLLTDVVMPGMNGSELAKHLVLRHPEMVVLFTSGYTEDVISRHGVLDEGVSFIGKPYTRSALAGKVREVLDKA